MILMALMMTIAMTMRTPRFASSALSMLIMMNDDDDDDDNDDVDKITQEIEW